MSREDDAFDRAAILRRRAVFVLSALAGSGLSGCGDSGPHVCLSAATTQSAGPADGGARSSAVDVGAPTDAGTDAGASATPSDAGPTDAAATDAGASATGDAGPSDAGASGDAGPSDAGAKPKPTGWAIGTAAPRTCLNMMEVPPPAPTHDAPPPAVPLPPPKR